jgi:osmotically-inducible protein OsmY
MKGILLITAILTLGFPAMLIAGGNGEAAGAKVSDEEIAEDVREGLFWDSRVDEEGIQVQVFDHAVTLRGEVSSTYSREVAEEIAWSVEGVVTVVNNLDVETQADYPVGTVIANNIRSRLNLNTDLDATEITVSVQGNTARLDGEVDSYWEKTEAEDIARNVPGVAEVVSSLTVVPTETISDERIAEEISLAVDRNIFIDEDNITVRVADGVVELSGVVEDRYAYNAVADIARLTQGVREVDNNMVIDEPRPLLADEVIREEIIDQLEWDTRVDADQVLVTVEDGEATLSGQVDSFREKQAAEDDAWQVAGVRELNNELEIRTVEETVTDTTIESSIENTILQSSGLEAEDVVIESQNRVVTLTGTVDAYWKKERLGTAASNILAVEGVENKIVIVPSETISDENLAARIIDSLEQNTLIRADRIDVIVDEGRVLLNGSVQSWLQKEAAVTAVENTRGLVEIDNNLVVEQ